MDGGSEGVSKQKETNAVTTKKSTKMSLSFIRNFNVVHEIKTVLFYSWCYLHLLNKLNW